MSRKLNLYFATFGQSHEHSNHYLRIYAVSRNKAKELMQHRFGNKWSFIHESIDDLDEFDKNRMRFDIVQNVCEHNPTL